MTSYFVRPCEKATAKTEEFLLDFPSWANSTSKNNDQIKKLKRNESNWGAQQQQQISICMGYG